MISSPIEAAALMLIVLSCITLQFIDERWRWWQRLGLAIPMLVVVVYIFAGCMVTAPELNPCYRITFWVDGEEVDPIAIDRGIPLTILTPDYEWVHPDSIAFSEWTPGECDS